MRVKIISGESKTLDFMTRAEIWWRFGLTHSTIAQSEKRLGLQSAKVVRGRWVFYRRDLAEAALKKFVKRHTLEREFTYP